MIRTFDTLVVGAGPAGIAAATTAAESGLRVGIVDDNPAAGGQIWRGGAPLPAAAERWKARFEAADVVRLQGWRVVDCPQPGLLRAQRNGEEIDRNSAEQGAAGLHYRRLILATGARERFLPFPGWTLPNVMGAGGLDAMVRGGMPIAGKRVVVAGTGPLLLAVAAHLAARGAEIVALCEQSFAAQMTPLMLQVLRQPGKLWQGAGYRWTTRKSPYKTRCWPVAALGDQRIRSVILQRDGKQWCVECDYLACGFHLVPNTELAELLGCRIEGSFVVTDELMQTSAPAVACAGEPTGIGGVELSLLEGQIAGLAAAGKTAAARKLAGRRRGAFAFVRALDQACRLNPELRYLAKDDTIVCRCEDVRLEALRGRAGWRDAKLHTRCGMGPCQGRICGGAAEFLFGWRADSVRPPLFPALVSSFLGFGAALDPTSHNMKETP
jgi:NADPH-dependent 2,4-dienoyl-CoA reductase/sulfur reductase-like enzyme